MAAARDGDISLWLHNKLGTSADTWSEGSICSQLNTEVLRNIKDCFVELQTQVKLKLLLSFFHIPKRNVEEWTCELEDILEVAVGDSEPWVTMLAEIMKTYPTTGSLNLDIREPAENQRMTHDLILDMKKLVRKHSELGLLPMECNFLNRNAFLAAAGQQVPLTKHFALKRKPKAAALRADLLQRSGDAQANLKKNQLPTVPVRSRAAPRKTDTTPMRGIPSRLTTMRTTGMTPGNRPLVRTNLNRKDGGIKLLDIKESPIQVQQSKKRRKVQDNENKGETEKSQREPAATIKTENVPQPAPLQTTPKIEPQTPDYAAGLTPSNPPTPSPATPTSTVLTSPQPNSIGTPTTPLGNIVRTVVPSSQVAALTTGNRIIVAGGQGPQQAQTILYRTVNSAGGGYTELVQATPVPISQNGENISGQPQYATLQPVRTDMVGEPVRTDLIYAGLPAAGATQVIAVTPSQLQQTTTLQPQATAPLQPPATQQPIQQQKRGLSLTKEQMFEAQEMFRTSNKVTRPEKALILGFMAGSRDNPCPHLGNIVTIKLSEKEEMVTQPQGNIVKMLAETHFQMNYNSGEWKRIRKYRQI